MSYIRDNKPVPATVAQEILEEAIITDSSVLIKNLINHNTILEVKIDVSILFDGTAPKASIGISTDHEKYLTEDQCDLTSINTYIIEDTIVLTSDESITVYITPDGSTQGTLTASVKYLDT
jgi:hypothetical protein